MVSDQYGGLVPRNARSNRKSTRRSRSSMCRSAKRRACCTPSTVCISSSMAKPPKGADCIGSSDTDDDDQFDTVELLKKIARGRRTWPACRAVGSGRHALRHRRQSHQAARGFRSAVALPALGEDQLLKRNPDGNGHATGVMAPGGWVCRPIPTARHWEIVRPVSATNTTSTSISTANCSPSTPTWNGTPARRGIGRRGSTTASPAAEFGWRYGTGKWPAYYVDSLGAVVDIGLGSPTGIDFGTGAKFPDKYQRALYHLRLDLRQALRRAPAAAGGDLHGGF